MRESRLERHRRERSARQTRRKKSLVPALAVFAFFVLALLVWITYENSGRETNNLQTAGPGEQADKPSGGTGTGQQPDSPKPDLPKPESQPTSGTPETAKPGGSGSSNGKPASSEGGTPAAKPPSNGGSAGTDDSRVQMAFVGDVIFASTVETLLKAKGWDYPYTNVKDYLQKPDLTVANLETPISDRGEEQKKEYTYRSSPAALPSFKEAGFDLVNLANNHILDYGVDGLLDTFDHLDKAGILRVGAGRSVSEAFKPVIVEKKGVKIAFLGFSKVVPTAEWKAGKYKDGKDRPGVADTYALDMPLEAIRQAKSQADLVVVIAHWGIERKDTPENYQKEYARKYIDAGADLIIGGHPHVLQGFESYKGKWIAYSLGNFIFTTRGDAPATWDSAILQASCSKKGECDLKVVPVLTKWALPEIMKEEDGLKLFERLSKISFGAFVGKDGAVQLK